MANGRSKLLIYPTLVIGVSAAAASATGTHISFRKGNDNNFFITIKYPTLKTKEQIEEEKLQLEAFRNEELRKLYQAVFKPTCLSCCYWQECLSYGLGLRRGRGEEEEQQQRQGACMSKDILQYVILLS